MTKNFVEEMKENGFDIEIIKNPVFFDEPTKEDIDEGTFETAETMEETPNEVEETSQEETNETEENENGN